MNCASVVVSIPVMRWRVVCAFFDVMLTFCPTSRLRSVDLPTFGRPTIATWPQRKLAGSDDSVMGSDSCTGHRHCVRGGGGGLFGGPSAGTRAARHDRQRRNPAVDSERLRMRFTGDGHDDVLGDRELSPLQPFLQPGLPVFPQRRRLG